MSKEEKSFEEKLSELEVIVKELESGRMSHRAGHRARPRPMP